MADRRLLSATAVMASGTLVSRLLGAVRVLLTGYIIFPKTRQADIFGLALMIPNSLYTIVATGLVNAILVPQIVRAAKVDPDQGEAFTNRIVTAFLMIFLAVTLACVAATPAITRLLAPAGWRVPELAAQYHSIVVLTAFCMPQIFLYGAFVLVGQVLNARGVFGPMMWAPVANNIIQIGAIGLYFSLYGLGGQEANSGPFTTRQMLVLAIGWAAALIVQFLVLVPFTRRIGFRYRPRFDFRGTGLGKTFSLAKWSLLFVVAANLALYAVTPLLMGGTAGGVGAGKAVYDNAYLIFAMPHSLIAVSVATAMVPTLSSLAAQNQLGIFARELASSVRLVVTALLPLALLLLALGRPIPEFVLRRDQGADLIGWTLMALAVGLVPFSVQYLLQRAYFAREDTRSVFLFELVMAVTWVTAAWLTVRLGDIPPRWIAPVVALANSLSLLVGLIVTTIHLNRRLPQLQTARLVRHLLRVLLAALPGSVLAWAIADFQTSRWNSVFADSLGLVAAGLAAVGVYLALSKLLHLTEVNQVVGFVTRRFRSKPDA